MTHHCLAQDGRLCPRCTYALGDTLRNIPDLYLRLEVEIVRATPPPTERSASKEAPLPVSAANLDLLTLNVEHIKGLDAVEGWCRLVIEERSVNWPEPLDSVYGRLYVATHFLTIHLEWMSSQPWVDEFAAEVRLVERALRHAVEPEERRFTPTQIRCVGEDCSGKFVIDHFDPGAKALLCRTCQARWEPEAFHLLAERIGGAVPIADVAAFTGINAKDLFNWVARGQIPNHGKPGAPRVLLSDCLTAWKARAA